MSWASALYRGTVTHRRLRPRAHRLTYRIVWTLLDLDELPALDRALRLFSSGRFNVFAFHERDHGDSGASGLGLRAQIDAHLAAAGIDLGGGAIRILCSPRVLGYVFNPISLYFCHRADGWLAAILYEVNNTFGDRHTYLIPVDALVNGIVVQECAKALHVSPFLGMEMSYRFRIAPPGATTAIAIEARDADGPVLYASFVGAREPLTDAALWRAFLAYPLVTLKAIAGIHWEALLLWRKGLSFHRRPAPPAAPVSIVAAQAAERERDHVDA